MPDPMQLPHELRLMIINHATDQADKTSRSDLYRVLCDLSLVSKRWHATLIEQIYSSWEYSCDHNSTWSLWKFLRTILSNRQIADTVQEIRYCSFEGGNGRNSFAVKPFAFSPGDRVTIRNAICKAGLAHIKPDVIDAIHNADPSPLFALLVANLRNLRTLRARLPYTDIFLTGVFREAAKCKQLDLQNDFYPLRRLREVYLSWIPWACYKCKHAQYIHVNLLWPIFQLPAIQRVSVSDFKPHELASRDEYAEDFGDIFGASTVTDVNLVLRANFDPSFATPSTFTIFALPERLTRLSIYLKGDSRFSNNVSNIDVWNGIRPYEEVLEYFDFYRDDEHEERDHPKLGSLRGFTRLERLYIQPRLLSDTDSFGETLPPNCHSLHFYFDTRLCFNQVSAFSRKLRDFISGAHLHTPKLWQILLDRDPNPMLARDVPLYDEVENACAQYGITFEAKRLYKDGEGPWNW